MEQGKRFKQSKPQKSTFASSVGQLRSEVQRGFGWAQIFTSCPRFDSLFSGLVSEGSGGGDQNLTHFRRPHIQRNSSGFPLNLGAWAKQPLV